jgi:molybdopterin converting factor small subunit
MTKELKPKVEAKAKPKGHWTKGKKRGISKDKIPVVFEGYDKKGHLIGDVSLLPVVHQPKLDMDKILKQKEAGLSSVEIADHFKVSVSVVNRALRDYNKAFRQVTAFKTFRGSILADLQRRILTSISDLDIKKANLGTKIHALCQLYEKERLENDLSTANIATLHDDIAALKDKDKK